MNVRAVQCGDLTAVIYLTRISSVKQLGARLMMHVTSKD
jgi:hypothetical protein